MSDPDVILRRGVEQSRYAGVAAQVVRAAVVAHRAVWGSAFDDGVHPEQLRDTALFDVASCTKGIATTGSLMTLVEQGEITLDDPLARYRASPDPRITLRQLLTHRAGLVEWQPLYLASDSRDEATDLAARLPLHYGVDEARHYSDLGFVLLGAVVEVVTGQRLDAAVASLVTGPLGMQYTGFGPVEPSSAVAYGHGDDIEQAMIRDGEPYPVTLDTTTTATFRNGWIRGEVSDGNAFHAMDGVSGHAGLFATLDDVTRFGTALIDGSSLWSAATLDQFLVPGDDGQAMGFWWLPAAGGPAYGHPGFTGARFLVDRARASVAVLLSNRLHVMQPGQRVPPDITPVWLDYLAATGFTEPGG